MLMLRSRVRGASCAMVCYQTRFALGLLTRLQGCVLNMEISGELFLHAALQVLECRQSVRLENEVSFKGASMFAQIPDMEMMNAPHTILLLQRFDDPVEFDIVGHGAHQQTGQFGA